MSAERIVREYVAAVTEQEPARFAALFAVDAVLHDPFFPEPTRGRERSYFDATGVAAQLGLTG